MNYVKYIDIIDCYIAYTPLLSVNVVLQENNKSTSMSLLYGHIS